MSSAVQSLGRVKLHEQVAQQLALRIVSGEIAADDSVPAEPDLAEQFAVSKTVVREAVQMLSSAGLVQVRHGKRTAVLDADSWNVLDPLVFEAYRALGKSKALLADLYAVRSLLEPPAARWTAERAEDEDVARLMALIDEISEAAKAGEEHRVLDADRRFHLQIIEIAGANMVLHAIFRDLEALLRGLWSMPLPQDHLAEIHRQHAAIADGIATGDGLAAEERMRAHIEWAARSDLAAFS